MHCTTNTWVYAAQVWNPHTAKNINDLNQSINELPTGLLSADGILFLRSGLKHLMNVFPVHIGLPLWFIEITYVFPYSMIFCTTRYSTFQFNSIYNLNFSCKRQHLLSIVPVQSTINSYQYFFLWSHPLFGMLFYIAHWVLPKLLRSAFHKALRIHFFIDLISIFVPFVLFFNYLYLFIGFVFCYFSFLYLLLFCVT